MSDDLVKRLREEVDKTYGNHPCGLLNEAAARIAELEAALRFYADAENWRRNGQLDPDSGNFTGGPASAALAGGKDE